MATNSNTHLIQYTASLPLGSLDSYVHWVNKVPMLSQEEEQELARSWQQNQDVDAARKMVLAHLRFVVKVARGYSGYGLAQGDLIQEGNVGLMKAVKRFDPAVGVRLVSFAVHWIKAEMHEFILRNWRIVKIATTKAQRKVFFNLRQMKKRLGWFTREEVESVASDLGVKPEVVLQMEARLNSHDMPFDLPKDAGDSVGGMQYVPACYLEDESVNPAQIYEASNWQAQGQQQLAAALEQLDGRSRDILQSRWLASKKVTLQVLAEKYRVSAERVRQLEQAALVKLKKFITNDH